MKQMLQLKTKKMFHRKRHISDDGSALSIVLVAFMIMSFALTMSAYHIVENFHNYHAIESLMKQKNLEIFLIKYYRDSVQNDILLSDDYSDDDLLIETTVDDMGDYYEVMTNIETSFCDYSFLTHIEVTSGLVLKLEYL